MKIDPYTMALCMRAMGVRKLTVSLTAALSISPQVEVEEWRFEPGRTIEYRLLEAPIDGELVG